MPRRKGRYVTTAWVPGNLLAPGTHYVKAVMRSIQRQVPAVYGTRYRRVYGCGARERRLWYRLVGGQAFGLIRPALDWSTEYIEESMKALG